MKSSKMLKVVSLVSASILSMGILAGCGSSSKKVSTDAVNNSSEVLTDKGSNQAQSDNVIVMGTNAEFEPFEYRDGLEITGFDVEIAKKIAEKLGKELVIEDMAFDTLIMALNSDKVDFIAAGMTATDERKTQVDFSDSYFKSQQMIIVKADDTTITTADDLAGKKVGVQLGTTGDLFVSTTEEIAEVAQFQAGTQAVMDLKNGKIDAVVIDAEPAKKMTEGQSDLKLLDAPFIEEEYAIAVKKGNDEILAAINETLAAIKADGTYDEIYAKYFDVAQ
ncbi:MAG: basic amino acid ABC transporter substrate-binding protein [Candidatus Cellulosilyticum pullistercoris]|uniref:Basic amino acid ABC transporter substrate-binding protein n=1 Tax=Candidatus Cellulosilyticum pullistercoris TaxID=2838521 RepID=A0A9E2NLE5_9FIRM|nr:basic amino acid ABC transporter substrate-binding protein [Candidatus Cellulosilyticum pullistercoris]